MKTQSLILTFALLLLASLAFSMEKPSRHAALPSKLKAFLIEELTYPEKDIHAPMEGTVLIHFYIDENSILQVTEIKSENKKLREFVMHELLSLPEFHGGFISGGEYRVKLRIKYP